MTTAVKTRPCLRVADIARYDTTNYSDPHPLVWATETVTLDDWEVVAYRRPIGTLEGDDSTLQLVIVQTAQPGSLPEVRVEWDGAMRLESVGIDWDADHSTGIVGAFRHAARQRGREFLISCAGWRVRPGALEAVADHYGVDSDVELAAAVKCEPIRIALLRAGFDPFARPLVSDWLDAAGLAGKGYSHAMRLAYVTR